MWGDVESTLWKRIISTSVRRGQQKKEKDMEAAPPACGFFRETGRHGALSTQDMTHDS